jgi:hypothetical protein
MWPTIPRGVLDNVTCKVSGRYISARDLVRDKQLVEVYGDLRRRVNCCSASLNVSLAIQRRPVTWSGQRNSNAS